MRSATRAWFAARSKGRVTLMVQLAGPLLQLSPGPLASGARHEHVQSRSPVRALPVTHTGECVLRAVPTTADGAERSRVDRSAGRSSPMAAGRLVNVAPGVLAP